MYFVLALLFIASSLGLGLVISTRANTQFEAEASSLVFMLFGLLLSGLFYPPPSACRWFPYAGYRFRPSAFLASIGLVVCCRSSATN